MVNRQSNPSHTPSRGHKIDAFFPSEVIVTSLSSIKTTTVENTLNSLWPDATFSVIGTKVPSDVSEQPIGQETVDGALNRLTHAREIGSAACAYISIENGLFRVSREADPDLSTEYDPEADYEDRAVVAISLPGIIEPSVFISPREDAVAVPSEIVFAAHSLPGGFSLHTAGEVLYTSGQVKDKQNPHAELTNGKLPREEQMRRLLVYALENLESTIEL